MWTAAKISDLNFNLTSDVFRKGQTRFLRDLDTELQLLHKFVTLYDEKSRLLQTIEKVANKPGKFQKLGYISMRIPQIVSQQLRLVKEIKAQDKKEENLLKIVMYGLGDRIRARMRLPVVPARETLSGEKAFVRKEMRENSFLMDFEIFLERLEDILENQQKRTAEKGWFRDLVEGEQVILPATGEEQYYLMKEGYLMETLNQFAQELFHKLEFRARIESGKRKIIDDFRQTVIVQGSYTLARHLEAASFAEPGLLPSGVKSENITKTSITSKKRYLARRLNHYRIGYSLAELLKKPEDLVFFLLAGAFSEANDEGKKSILALMECTPYGAVVEAIDLTVSGFYGKLVLRKGTTTTRETLVTVLLPCYNEGPRVVHVIECAKEFCSIIGKQGIKSEIIVIDNNSQDNSYQAALSTGVRVLKETRQGIGFAMSTGYRASTPWSLKKNVILKFDTDTRNPRDQIVQWMYNLSKPIIDGKADVVRSVWDPMGFPANLRSTDNIAYNLLYILPKFPWTNKAQTGFQAFRASAVQDALVVPQYGFDLSLFLQILKRGARYKEVKGFVPDVPSKGQGKILPLGNAYAIFTEHNIPLPMLSEIKEIYVQMHAGMQKAASQI